jgi:Ser/Thr protein kinase RdoA (MazF antagonist)
MEPLLEYIACHETRARARRFLTSLREEALPRLADLPQQIIHNDFSPTNILCRGDAVTGIVDFGDMMRAPRVLDPATACSYLILDRAQPFRFARAAMRSYLEANPLAQVENVFVPQLMMARRLLSVLITNWTVRLFPDNAGHILKDEPASRAALRRLDGLGTGLSQAFWRDT